jgi:ATP-dependent helicase/nuclease subunit B
MIIIQGYPWFNAEEFALVEQMMQSAGEFLLAIETSKVHINDELNPLELFYDGKRLYQTLYQKARSLELKILHDIWAKPSSNHADIDATWQNLVDNQRLSIPDATKANIQLWMSENRVSEVDKIAKEIHRLVVEENYRYKDIQILTRDLQSYHSHLAPVLQWNNIPFSMDRVDDIKNHPIFEFLKSLFAIQKQYFRYEDVLNLLRSELFVPIFDELDSPQEQMSLEDWQMQMEKFRKSVDITENIVLQYGYERQDWTKKKDWKFVHYEYQDEEVLENRDEQKERISNEVRRFVGNNISLFFKKLLKAKNGKEAVQLFYDFLIHSKVDQQIIYLRDFNADVNSEKARDYEHVWHALMVILEEYVQIFGEATFDFDSFVEVITTGLENHKFGKLPATIDTVQITSMELARPNQAKVVFAIGLTNHTLPKTYENNSILTQEERDQLSESLEEGKFFYNDVRKRTAKEIFLAYEIFLSASEKLYLTYPQTIDGAKDNRLSPFVDRFVKAMNVKQENRFEATMNQNSQEVLSNISTYRILIRDLMRLHQQASEENVKPPVLWSALERELQKSDLKELFYQVKESLEHLNIPENLTPKTVQELYGNEIQASVSRFELFHLCEYQHFANYGLKLRERDVLELNPALAGSYFHEAMDYFFKLVKENKIELREIEQADLDNLTIETIQKINAESKYDLFNRDARHRYLQSRLANVVSSVLWGLHKQAKISTLTTIATETAFGLIAGKKGLDSYKFDLGNEQRISLRGIIDRIDSLQVGDEAYLGIVDYKSGNKRFSLDDSYYGLAMQMVTYLDVAVKNFGENPLGSLYFHLKDPIMDAGEVDLNNLDAQRMKEFKYNGFLLKDSQVLSQLEQQLDGYGQVYPIRATKAGTNATGTSFASNELDTLMQYNREKFVQAGKEILSGNIELNPVREGKNPRACAFCKYRSICGFDSTLKENNYVPIKKAKKEEVLDLMRADLESG